MTDPTLDKVGTTFNIRGKNTVRKFTKGTSIGLKTWESKSVKAPNGDDIIITSTPARHGPVGIEKVSGDLFIMKDGHIIPKDKMY